MKTYLPQLSLLALAMASLSITAQTAAHSSVHHTAAAAEHHTEGGCVKLPDLSAKVPALPPGTPCARAMFIFTTVPSIRMDYVSPLVSPEMRDGLGLTPTTFSLDYSEIKVGTGELALPHKWYTVNYTGYLVDGTKFDSSFDHGEPFSFPIGEHRVIAGWDLGMQGMHVGGKRRLYVPYQLAYGERAQRGIPAKSELVFDIELVSQSDTAPAPKAPAVRKPAPTPNSSMAQPGQPGAAPTQPNTPINTETPNAKAPSPK